MLSRKMSEDGSKILFSLVKNFSTSPPGGSAGGGGGC